MAMRSNQSILKEINPEYSLKGLMLKLHSFGHLMHVRRQGSPIFHSSCQGERGIALELQKGEEIGDVASWVVPHTERPHFLVRY